MQTTFTKNDIAALLTNNDMAVVRAIEALYLRQTEDEKASDTTSHRNGRGFNGTDAFILSRFAVQIAEWRTEKVANGRTRFPFPLSTREGGQLALARKKIMKYAGQLADIANDKAGVKAEVKVELPTIFPDAEVNALYHEMMGQAKARVQNDTDAERDAQKAVKKAARDVKRGAEFAAYHTRVDAKQAAIEAELEAEMVAERAAIQAIEAGEVDFDDEDDTFGPAPVEVEDEYLSLV